MSQENRNLIASRRGRLEALRSFPAVRSPGSSCWSALGGRSVYDSGQSTPRCEANATPAPGGSSLYRDLRDLLHRPG
jgi:hypothetical protein